MERSGNNSVTYAYSSSSVEVDFKIGLGYVSAGDKDTLSKYSKCYWWKWWRYF